ncbi:MAG: M3 family metallopeptidase [Gammaproteobacteria bacterium]|nr:M3 family metallopeptidase [Gammaproteobacteria bacterium]
MPHDMPPFSSIKAKHIRPALESIIADNQRTIDALVKIEDPDWDIFIQPLEELDERLSKMWDTVSLLNAVLDDEVFRENYRLCLPILSDYTTRLTQNKQLYRRYQSVRDSSSFADFDLAQQTLIENALRDFRLSGVALPEAKKESFRAIQSELSILSNRFEKNVLDATDHWFLHILDEKKLSGLPDTAISLAREQATHKALDGWVFSLQAPYYIPFIMFADDRVLRRQMYEAHVTRASDAGPDAGRWDNSTIIDNILKLRREKAALLGFDDYVDYALQTRMAENSHTVSAFLSQLSAAAKPAAQRELLELSAFASQEGISELQAWDLPYYSEKLRQRLYDISQEDVRPWFPLDSVLHGLFEVINRLFGLTVKRNNNVEIWHTDVRYYEICDNAGAVRGRFFLDLFARKGKRGGAWMGDGISYKKTSKGVQKPLAWLVTNFSPPAPDKPSLLSHDEVITLFHEFGHGLHHLLTRVAYPAVSGINGVPWDAVELPSQMMENWAWQNEVLKMISGHFETGEPLPVKMVTRLNETKIFQAGMLLLRQLEFALFDLTIHQGTVSVDVQQTLDQVRAEVCVFIPPEFNRFQNSFSHIFSGGYASGYYSYSWAEVLSADAFSLFEEKGIFDSDTALSFLKNILEKGGSQDTLTLFRAFRGRDPVIDALLRHRGLTA